MQQTLQKIKTNLLLFLELQLLISLVILPILINWGLPISIMSIAGNLLFAQFLTIFIFLSALLFSSDLLGIPNYFIAQTLEWFTSVWYYFLSFGSASWLVGFSSWMLPISSIFAIIGCTLYYDKKISQNNRIIILGILFIATFFIHHLLQPQLHQVTILQGSQKMHLIKVRSKIYAFDCGALGARPSSQSWIEYTVTPTLIQTMGTTAIDTLILCKSNSRTKQAVEKFIYYIQTRHLMSIEKATH